MRNLWVYPDDLGESAASEYAWEACQAASHILWSMSGRKYSGQTTVTETYEMPLTAARRAPLETYNVANRPYGSNNYGAGGYGVDALITEPVVTTAGHQHLRLRGRPVQAVHEVQLRGRQTPLSPDNYYVENKSVLSVTGCANIDEITVTYTYGARVPAAGRRAAAYLARQFCLGWSGDDECELPEHVTSISRQGVSYTLLDNTTLVDDLRTGIYSVDLFLKSVNPDNARKRARVFSPDLPNGKRIARRCPLPPALQPFDWTIARGSAETWVATLTNVPMATALTAGYAPLGQVSTLAGQILFEVPAAQFALTATGVTATVTAEQTARFTGDYHFKWDLFATSGAAYKHLLTSNIYVPS